MKTPSQPEPTWHSSEPGEAGPPPQDEPEQMPRGARAMAVVRWVMLAMTIVVAAGSWWTFARADASATAAARYQCPMHPQIVSNEQGDCPICFMSLEPIAADRLAGAASAPSFDAGVPDVHEAGPVARDSGTAPRYTCPMHPEVVADQPGRCPICKMALVPEGKQDGDGAEAGATPDGAAPVYIGLDRVQAMGVRTAVVQERDLVRPLRVTAVVAAPEQNVAEVHVRAPAFVEGIAVRETGVTVKAGQLLVSVYSPEIYQAQSELLAMRDMPSLSGGPDAARTDAAKRKLELLGVPVRVSEQILASGKPLRAVGLSAPMGGVVTRKNVVLGSYVTPDMVLYEITDLSRIYVIAEVFQQDMERVTVGMRGRFQPVSRKDVMVDATVDLVYPQVNPEARTTRVRMQLDNAKLGLLPGEYGYVELESRATRALVIPRDAVVDTGKQTYVFVAEESSPGSFSPRLVELGAESGDEVQVRKGLTAGLRVVSGATFLLDAESRLRASLASAPAP
jgi:Cu(I)/Ag(I) efflux system membrane fusion protein